MAMLGTPVLLLLPIPFDAPHKGAAKFGRTPLRGGVGSSYRVVGFARSVLIEGSVHSDFRKE